MTFTSDLDDASKWISTQCGFCGGAHHAVDNPLLTFGDMLAHEGCIDQLRRDLQAGGRLPQAFNDMINRMADKALAERLERNGT